MAIFSQEISLSSWDAYEVDGVVTLDGNALNANTATQYIGFMFQTSIPKYATINSATLDVYVTSGSYDDPDTTVYCGTGRTSGFETSLSDVSSQITTSGLSWIATGIGTGVKTLPELKTIVQERVNQDIYNPILMERISIIIKGNNSSSKIRLRAYDAGGGNYATLTIDYTPVSNVPQRLTRPYLRM